MKKAFFIALACVAVFFTSCKKEKPVLLLVDYYTCGNDSDKPIIYKNDKVLYTLSQDYFVSDICCKYPFSSSETTDIYLCGHYTDSEGVTHPVLWNNDSPANMSISNKEGKLNQIIYVNSELISVGQIEDKGVVVIEGGVKCEYAEEGKSVDFKLFQVDALGNLFIGGYIDNKVAYWIVKKVDGKYTVSKPTIVSETGMKYDENSYEIKDIFINYSTVYMAITGTVEATGRTFPVISTNEVIRNDFNLDNSINFTCNTLAPYVGTVWGGSFYDKTAGYNKAFAYGGNVFGNGMDVSNGLPKADSEVLKIINDGFGNLHLVIVGRGKIQYQVLGFAASGVLEYACPSSYVPTNTVIKITQQMPE